MSDRCADFCKTTTFLRTKRTWGFRSLQSIFSCCFSVQKKNKKNKLFFSSLWEQLFDLRMSKTLWTENTLWSTQKSCLAKISLPTNYQDKNFRFQLLWRVLFHSPEIVTKGKGVFPSAFCLLHSIDVCFTPNALLNSGVNKTKGVVKVKFQAIKKFSNWLLPDFNPFDIKFHNRPGCSTNLWQDISTFLTAPTASFLFFLTSDVKCTRAPLTWHISDLFNWIMCPRGHYLFQSVRFVPRIYSQILCFLVWYILEVRKRDCICNLRQKSVAD